jgi:hypothetical protein
MLGGFTFGAMSGLLIGVGLWLAFMAFLAIEAERRQPVLTWVLAVDFDHVINRYGGWQDEGYDVILDRPVDGAREALERLIASGFTIVVHTVRAGHPGGAEAVRAWCIAYGIPCHKVTATKPLADAYLDDKAIHFRSWPQALNEISKRLKVQIARNPDAANQEDPRH